LLSILTNGLDTFLEDFDYLIGYMDNRCVSDQPCLISLRQMLFRKGIIVSYVYGWFSPVYTLFFLVFVGHMELSLSSQPALERKRSAKSSLERKVQTKDAYTFRQPFNSPTLTECYGEGRCGPPCQALFFKEITVPDQHISNVERRFITMLIPFVVLPTCSVMN